MDRLGEARAGDLRKASDDGVRAAKAPFRQAVLVCGKCARKLDGEGFGRKRRQPLRKALKATLKGGGWGRKVRVVETACLGLCPRGRQVAAAGGDLEARRLIVVDPGADPAAVLERLIGPSADEGGGADRLAPGAFDA